MHLLWELHLSKELGSKPLSLIRGTISPDQRSGRAFHIEASLRGHDAVFTHVEAHENFRIRLFCATNQKNVPEKVQTTKGRFSKVYKTNFPATQNPQLGRELTKSNIISALGKEEIRRMSRSRTRLRRTSPDPQSGEAISDPLDSHA
jgi:hypothetical protein